VATPGDTVRLSRRAGIVVRYLNMDAIERFTQAVRESASINQVRQPYRRWLEDVRLIPIEARKTRFNPNTGERKPIQIRSNPDE
jgi:hypothetical protein